MDELIPHFARHLSSIESGKTKVGAPHLNYDQSLALCEFPARPTDSLQPTDSAHSQNAIGKFQQLAVSAAWISASDATKNLLYTGCGNKVAFGHADRENIC